MVTYVLGFCRDPDTGRVALIRKRRPDWQTGRLNGVGGHMEETDPSAEDAMEREFFEETGVCVPAKKWRLYCELSGPPAPGWRGRAGSPEWIVFCLSAEQSLGGARQTTDEELVLVSSSDLPPECIDNLKWLVPMAFAASPVHADVRELRAVSPKETP